MAIDSEAKRWSMLSLAGGPPRIIVFNPDTSGLSSIEKITVLQYYGGISWQSVSPPTFDTNIDNITVTFGHPASTHDFSGNFSGTVDSYSIAPSVPLNWSFDTATGVLTVRPTVIGVFGTFVVTATNTGGSDDSNAFIVTVLPGAGGAEAFTIREGQDVPDDDDRVMMAVIAEFMRHRRRLN